MSKKYTTTLEKFDINYSPSLAIVYLVREVLGSLAGCSNFDWVEVVRNRCLNLHVVLLQNVVASWVVLSIHVAPLLCGVVLLQGIEVEYEPLHSALPEVHTSRSWKHWKMFRNNPWKSVTANCKAKFVPDIIDMLLFITNFPITYQKNLNFCSINIFLFFIFFSGFYETIDQFSECKSIQKNN